MTIVFNRRVAIAAALTAVTDSVVSSEDGRPKVTRPRATDGDDRSEPDWDEHLTITVGNQGADINGKDDRAIQAAVDYIRRIGTGTVKLTAGVFQLRNAIHLPLSLIHI